MAIFLALVVGIGMLTSVKAESKIVINFDIISPCFYITQEDNIAEISFVVQGIKSTKDFRLFMFLTPLPVRVAPAIKMEDKQSPISEERELQLHDREFNNAPDYYLDFVSHLVYWPFDFDDPVDEISLRPSTETIKHIVDVSPYVKPNQEITVRQKLDMFYECMVWFAGIDMKTGQLFKSYEKLLGSDSSLLPSHQRLNAYMDTISKNKFHVDAIQSGVPEESCDFNIRLNVIKIIKDEDGSIGYDLCISKVVRIKKTGNDYTPKVAQFTIDELEEGQYEISVDSFTGTSFGAYGIRNGRSLCDYDVHKIIFVQKE